MHIIKVIYFYAVIGMLMAAHRLPDFKKKFFSIQSLNPGIYDLDVGLSRKNEWPVVLADLNGNSYTDLITVDNDYQTLNIYIYDKIKYQFNKEQTLKITSVSGQTIAHVYTGDFNHDYERDILVVLDDSSKYEFVFLFKDSKIGKYVIKKEAKITNLDQSVPTIFQLFEEDHSNLVTYILYQEADVRKVVNFKELNVKNIVDFSTYVVKDQGCKSYSIVKGNRISPVFSSSFVDLNMDCQPDLFLETTDGTNRKTEIYYFQSKSQKFCLVDIGEISTNMSHVSFTDIRNTGSNDAVMISKDMTIKIFLNKYELKNNGGNLCTAKINDRDAPFVSFTSQNSTSDFYSYKLPGMESNQFVPDSSSPFSHTVVRFGDLDLDGKQDIVINVKNKEDSKFYAVFLRNIDCPDTIKDSIQSDSCSYFDAKPFKKDFSSLNQDHSSLTAFFDWGETGNLGILQVNHTKDDSKPSIVTIFNYMNKDNYFLKAIGKSQSTKSSDFCVGCSFAIVKTELNGDKHNMFASQAYSIGSTRLMLPFIFVGLGRINNYIENFNFAVAKEGSWANNWSPIIPNSQLMVAADNSKPSKWSIEIFINPTDSLWLIVISTITVLVVLGLIIIILYFKEKKEDKKENDDNFDYF